jgi:peptide/nickel transport system permease protein
MSEGTATADGFADTGEAILAPPSRGPWVTALRKLARDKGAMAALALFLCIVALCLMAPVYAGQIAHTDPFRSNLRGKITVDGATVPVMQPSTEGLGLGLTPIGPTWDFSAYFLGADNQGRDVAARMLYGGRNSLFIAAVATAMTLVLAALVGCTAGFFGGPVDWVLSRLLDVMWAFPIYLLAISLSIVLISKGIRIGPFTIESGSLSLPIFIIGIVYVPYVARPIRGQVLALKQSEFVTAAIGLGVPAGRILLRDILPNVTTTLIVFVPLMMAINMVTESALSFLSIGVQPPQASWGTIIQDGQGLLYTRPMVAVAPGVAIVLAVLALNVLGDGIRDALDPRAKVRIRQG